MFYRLVDSPTSDEMVEEIGRVRDIESTIFGGFKGSDDQFKESWQGSLEDNKRADSLVAAAIRKSFQSYERRRKEGEPTYFKF